MATGFTYRHYILKDHLGSWTTITDAEGNVEQELSFDAWGNLRDADTWTGTGTEAPMFDRGYTGHEHITAFGLINMKFALSESRAKFYLGYAERCKLGKANGRLYDPMLGRSNGNAFNTDLSEGDFSPIYDVNGKFLGTIKGGFTGQVLIYDGTEDVDFSALSEDEALSIEDVSFFDMMTSKLTGEAKSNI